MLLSHRVPPRPDPAVPELVAELRRRGYVVELVTHDCCGEEDPRLHVWDAVSPVTVEVLLTGERWPVEHRDAVRVDGDHRLLWRDPCTAPHQEELIGFIGDLLRDEPLEVLSSRYRLLG